MQIKRQKPEDARTERYIITSMIVSDEVCRLLQPTYDKKYFLTKLTREVAEWCMSFFEQYEVAPKQDIQSIFEMKVKSGKIDPDLGDEIEKFLESISEQYEEEQETNVSFYVDLGQNYFKKRSFLIFSDEIRHAAENNDVQGAEKKYTEYNRVQIQQDQARKILEPEGQEAFRKSSESRPPHLFRMPGALGQIIGDIERETFIGLLGREKVGKTFNLMNFAIAGAKQGLKVAMIETGDLTQDQLDNRFNCAFTGKTYKESRAGVQLVPIMDCIHNQTGQCERIDADPVVHRTTAEGRLEFIEDIKDNQFIRSHSRCVECYKDRDRRHQFQGSIWWREKDISVWTWGEARRITEHFRRRFKGQIVTECFPEIKISAVRDWVINKQKKENFVPDILIVDYPDICTPENEGQEKREQENRKWRLGRQMSQEFHNCVIFATQADAKAYKKASLKLDNFSEDKRKYSHVTHFLAVNKTEEEEIMGCCRMGTLLIREDSLQVTKQVTVLQELATSKPYVGSFFGRVPGMKK